MTDNWLREFEYNVQQTLQSTQKREFDLRHKVHELEAQNNKMAFQIYELQNRLGKTQFSQIWRVILDQFGENAYYVVANNEDQALSAVRNSFSEKDRADSFVRQLQVYNVAPCGQCVSAGVNCDDNGLKFEPQCYLFE